MPAPLPGSPFVSVEEAREFANWYDTHEHHTNWDDERYGWAWSILESMESDDADEA